MKLLFVSQSGSIILTLFDDLCYITESTIFSLSLTDLKIRFLVNFDAELLEIACECRHLEQLGYHIPELTRNLALQLDKYLSAQHKLQMMIDRYHLLLDSLNPAEVYLLTL